MDPIKLIIDDQICRLRQEAKANRLLRIAAAEGDRPRGPSWPTRARRRLGDTLIAAGETLRSSADEQTFDRAA